MKRAALLLIGLVVVVSGCDDNPSECEELGEVCHDTGTDLGQECHEVGHHGDEDECAERYDECIAECTDQ
jgi:hypothetical protein